METEKKVKKPSILWRNIRGSLFWAVVMVLLLWLDVPGKLVSLLEKLDSSGLSSNTQEAIEAVPVILLPMLNFCVCFLLIVFLLDIFTHISRRIAVKLKAKFKIPVPATRWPIRLFLFWGAFSLLRLALDPGAAEVLLMSKLGMYLEEILLLFLLKDGPREIILKILHPVIPLLMCVIAVWVAVILLVVLICLLRDAVKAAGVKSRQRRIKRAEVKAQKEEEELEKPVRSKAGSTGMIPQQAKAADTALSAYQTFVKKENAGVAYLWVKPLNTKAAEETMFLWDRDELHVRLERDELFFRREKGRAWLLGDQKVELLPNSPCPVYMEMGNREVRQILLTYIK